MDPHFDKVAVIGVGLLGSSLAAFTSNGSPSTETVRPPPIASTHWATCRSASMPSETG